MCSAFACLAGIAVIACRRQGQRPGKLQEALDAAIAGRAEAERSAVDAEERAAHAVNNQRAAETRATAAVSLYQCCTAASLLDTQARVTCT